MAEIKRVYRSAAGSIVLKGVLPTSNPTVAFEVKNATFSSGGTKATVSIEEGAYTVRINVPASTREDHYIHLIAVVGGTARTVQVVIVSSYVRDRVRSDIKSHGFQFANEKPVQDTDLMFAYLSGTQSLSDESLSSIEQKSVEDFIDRPGNPSHTWSFIYDNPLGTLYTLNDFDSLETAQVHNKHRLDLVGYFGQFGPLSNRRELVLAHKSGEVQILNERMIQSRSIDIGIPISKMVERKESIVLIDAWGRIHEYTRSLEFIRRKSDQVYLDVASEHEVYITHDYKVIGRPDLPTHLNYYEIFDENNGNYRLYAYNPINISEVYEFDGTSQRLIETAEGKLAYSVGSRTYRGVETDGGIKLGSLQIPPEYSNVTTMFLSPLQGEGDAQNLYMAYRPIEEQSHFALPYTVTFPELAVTFSESYEISFDIVVDDPEILLPISLPEGFTWTATRAGQEENITHVLNGDRVTLYIEPPQELKTDFVLGLGEAVSMVKVELDVEPNAFTFKHGTGMALDQWHKTNTVLIEDLDVQVPVKIEYAYAYKVYINGVLVEDPELLYVGEGDTLQIEAQFGHSGSPVLVTVGKYETSFTMYEDAEEEIAGVRNWVYADTSTYHESDTIENTNTVPIYLKIDSMQDAVFSNKEKQIELLPDETTKILYKAQPNTKEVIAYSTENFSYTWEVWSHAEVLDSIPDYPPALRYEKQELVIPVSEAVPLSFWTSVYIPAGTIVKFNEITQTTKYDQRGLGSEGLLLDYQPADTEIRILSMPKESGYTLTYGSMSVEIRHDFSPLLTHTTEGMTVDTFPIAFSAREETTNYVKQETASYAEDLGVSRIKAEGTYSQATESDIYLIDYIFPAYKEEKTFNADMDLAYHKLEEISRQTSRAEAYHSKESKSTVASGLPQNETIQIEARIDVISAYRELSGGTATLELEPQEYQYGLDIEPTDLIAVWEGPSLDRVAPLLPETSTAVDVPSVDPYGSIQKNAGSYNHEMIIDFYEEPEYVKQQGFGLSLIHADAIQKINPYGHSSIASGLVYRLEGFVQQYAQEEEYRHGTGFIYSDPHIHDTLIPTYVQDFVSLGSGQYDIKAGIKLYPEYVPNGHVPESSAESGWAGLEVIFSSETIPKHVEPEIVMKLVGQSVHTREISAYGNEASPYHALDISNYMQESFGFGSPDVNLIDSRDPIKDGYFETELAALQNAVDVWSKEPSSVYAILQPNGFYTWAQVVVCEDLCFGASCSTRGYISGG